MSAAAAAAAVAASSDIVRRNRNAVFSFGRFQPPTTGHKSLIDKISEYAHSHPDGADGYVFVSSSCNDLPKYTASKKYATMKNSAKFDSCDKNENPLRIEQKIKWLKVMYPRTNVRFINTTTNACKGIFAIKDALLTAGYETAWMIVGSDRLEGFTKMFKDDPRIKVISPLEARSDKTMSGTAMRKAAVAGNMEAFRRGVMIGDMTPALADELAEEIRVGVGYKGGRRPPHRRRRSYTRKLKSRR